MKSLIFNLKFLAILTIFSFVASCTKDDASVADEENVIGIRTDELTKEDCVNSFADLQGLPQDALDVEALPHPRPDKCFKLNYPVSIQFPDSTVVTVNSKEELITSVKTWRQSNPTIHGRPHLVYPVSITMKDGTVLSVNSKEEMKKIIFDCMTKWRHVKIWRCLDLVFPVTLVFPDGSTLLVNSKEELKEALIAWRLSNSNIEGHPTIQFPFDIKLKNGDIITIDDLEELKDIVKKCIKRKWYRF
jgi:hypothetical protein